MSTAGTLPLLPSLVNPTQLQVYPASMSASAVPPVIHFPAVMTSSLVASTSTRSTSTTPAAAAAASRPRRNNKRNSSQISGGRTEEDDDDDSSDSSSAPATRRRKNSGGKGDNSGEPEESAKSKRERNKVSAMKYRKRRKVYLDTLEKQVSDLNDTVSTLATENKMLQEQLSFFKSLYKGGNAPAPSTSLTNASASTARNSLVMFAVMACLLFCLAPVSPIFSPASVSSSVSAHSGPSRVLLSDKSTTAVCDCALPDVFFTSLSNSTTDHDPAFLSPFIFMSSSSVHASDHEPVTHCDCSPAAAPAASLFFSGASFLVPAA